MIFTLISNPEEMKKIPFLHLFFTHFFSDKVDRTYSISLDLTVDTFEISSKWLSKSTRFLCAFWPMRSDAQESVAVSCSTFQIPLSRCFHLPGQHKFILGLQSFAEPRYKNANPDQIIENADLNPTLYL